MKKEKEEGRKISKKQGGRKEQLVQLDGGKKVHCALTLQGALSTFLQAWHSKDVLMEYVFYCNDTEKLFQWG